MTSNECVCFCFSFNLVLLCSFSNYYLAQNLFPNNFPHINLRHGMWWNVYLIDQLIRADIPCGEAQRTQERELYQKLRRLSLTVVRSSYDCSNDVSIWKQCKWFCNLVSWKCKWFCNLVSWKRKIKSFKWRQVVWLF